MIKLRLFLISITLLGINACSSRPDSNVNITTSVDTVEQRTQKIKALKQWKIQGRIAFIRGKERESASIYWRTNLQENTQELNLTTILGINVFSLASNQGSHLLEVDGKDYHSDDLGTLLYSLTGFQLPVEQLHFWLFGLKAYPDDNISYNPQNALPITLQSHHNGTHWQIHYSDYRREKSIDVPSKLTIRQGDLLIKMQLSDWNI